MSIEAERQLIEFAQRLRNTNKLVVMAIVEGRGGDVLNLLGEYVLFKKELKALMAGLPVIQVHDQSARTLLLKVSQEIPLETDTLINLIEQKSDEPVEFEALDDDEINDLGEDLFYSWINHWDYVQDLYRIGSLIVAYSVPEALQVYVEEVRKCYALQQYNAVVALSRTILEAAIRHTCERRGLIQKQGKRVSDIDAYRPAELIRKVSTGAQRQRIQDLYTRTSTLIHGQNLARSDDALSTLKDTLRVVNELYS